MDQLVKSVPDGKAVLAYLRESTRKPMYELGHDVLVPYDVSDAGLGFDNIICWYEGKVTWKSHLHDCFDVYIPKCNEVVEDVMGCRLIDMKRSDEEHLTRLKKIITMNQAYIYRANEKGLVPYKKGLYLGK